MFFLGTDQDINNVDFFLSREKIRGFLKKFLIIGFGNGNVDFAPVDLVMNFWTVDDEFIVWRAASIFAGIDDEGT